MRTSKLSLADLTSLLNHDPSVRKLVRRWYDGDVAELMLFSYRSMRQRLVLRALRELGRDNRKIILDAADLPLDLSVEDRSVPHS